MENSLEENIRVYRKETTTERFERFVSKNSRQLLVAIIVVIGIVLFATMVFMPPILRVFACIFYFSIASTIFVALLFEHGFGYEY